MIIVFDWHAFKRKVYDFFYIVSAQIDPDAESLYCKIFSPQYLAHYQPGADVIQ